jgi:predicted RNA-binding protein with RPS1 domain
VGAAHHHHPDQPEKIGEIIGPKGKTIRAIQEETGAQISVDDTGLVTIASVSGEGGERAKARIKGMTQEPEIGLVYEGVVKSTTTFGAFVEILPGTEGLLHISELQEGRTERTEDVVKKGDIVRVKLLSIDEKGKMRLSRKAAMAEEGAAAPPEPSDRPVRRTELPGGLVVLTEAMPGIRSASLGVWVRAGSVTSRPRRWASAISSSTWSSRARAAAAPRARARARAARRLARRLHHARAHQLPGARARRRHRHRARRARRPRARARCCARRTSSWSARSCSRRSPPSRTRPTTSSSTCTPSLMWGDHPYGYSILGTRDTVAALTVDDLRRVHAERYSPRNWWWRRPATSSTTASSSGSPRVSAGAPDAAGGGAAEWPAGAARRRRSAGRAWSGGPRRRTWSGARRRSGRAIRAASRWSCCRTRSAAA